MLTKKIIITGIIAFSAFLTANAQTLLKGFRAVSSYAALGNTLLFAADDGVHGVELWKTDGTAAGTTLVKDINPGINPSAIDKMFVYNSKLYFQANDGINGLELWQSDGTANGTFMLKNINTAAGDNNASWPFNFTVFNGALYFTAEADGNFSTLWKTDGTAAGTVQVTAPDNSSISQLKAVGNTLYFVKNGTSLWKSDGTAAGTQQIQVDDYYEVDMLTNVSDNELVFITSYTDNHNNIRLYKIDPANNTPVMLHSYDAVTYGSNDIGNITPVGSNILFSIHTTDANSNINDALWISDGTVTGTTSIGSWQWELSVGGSYAAYFKAFNNKLYFAGPTDHTLWTSDGTLAGTKKASNVIVEGYMVQSGSLLYFNGNGNLYGFDGTTATRQSQSPANPVPLTSANNKLYFTAPNGYYETEIWNNAPAPVIQVNGPNGPWANSTAQTLIAKADSIQTGQVTIVNQGNQPLTISDISVAGNAFYVNGQPSRTIAPNGHASFNLIYYPLKQGNDNAILLIKSTDNSGQQNFNGLLNGTASGAATKTPPVDSLEKKIVFRDSIPAFTLSANTIAENAAPGTTIGSFKVNDTTAGYQFQLVAGAGDYDNSSFQIVNGQLQSAATFNFSAKDTYVIRVKAASNTASYQKSFPVQVSNVQAAPPAQNCAAVFQGLMFSLYDAVYAGSRIVAVGTAGTILISDDDGATWKKIKNGITSDLSMVRFTDSQTGYILGSTAMLKTEDGGDTWFPLAIPVNFNYTVMSFPSSTTGYLVGGGSTYNPLYKTTDGGRSWKSLNPGTSNSMSSIWFTDEKNGFIGGSLIGLLHTTDGGATWQPVSLNLSDTFAAINSISFFNSSIGFLTTNSGDILKTTDGGATWAKISTLSTDGFVSRVYMLDQNTGYIMCGYNQATMYKTTDGGVSWQNDNTGVITVFRAMAINSVGTKLCAVGLGTYIGSSYGSAISLKSGSGSWVPRSYIAPDSYYNNSFVGGNLFANGDGFVFGPTSNFRTTDAGLTWSSMNIVPDWNNPITNGNFVNTTIGFYTDYYHMYRTTDGGNSWTKVLTDSLSPIQKIYFFDAQHGFYINDAYAGMTTDGGNTWSKSLVTGQGIPINDIRFLDAQHGYAVCTGTFYKTIDGGQTWSSLDLGSDKYLMSVYFTGVNNGLIGGSNGLLLHTADGGTTWTTVVTLFQFDVSKLVFYDALHGYAIDNNPGGVNLIYETFDGGLTWNPDGANWSSIRGFNINDGQLFTTGSTVSKLSSDGLGPVNAGYIAGSTKVAVGNKVLYSVPAEQGITYQWAVTGADEVEFHNDTVYVVWKQGGQYNLQVTPYNSCGAGLSRSMDLNVLDMPDPVITGPDSVASHAANVVYTAPAETGRSYSWTAQGSSSISSTDNQAKVNWGAPGDGLVAVIKTDTALNLRKSGSLQVKINKTALPSTNFKVSVTSATCKGTDDGYITVVADASYDYTALVSGPNSFSKTYAFTDSMKVSNLAAGSYNVCIGLKDDTSFRQCYGLNLTEPKDLSVYSTVNPANGTVTLDLSGANVYNITLNGITYQTKAGQITMSLNKGANKLELSSDKECQGVIVRYINLNKITLYPDPFADHISIDLGGSTATQTKVEIRDINGRVLYSKKQLNTSGALNIDVPGLQSGSYLLQLTLDDQSTVFKIVRK